MKYWSILICAVLYTLITPALAAQQTDIEADFNEAPISSELEQEARNIGRQLRCVVCQNQSIEESDAPLAADMRRMVREQLRQGADAAEVVQSMQARYGDFVLLKPPVQTNTLVLWGAPLISILLVVLWWIMAVRRKAPVSQSACPEISASDNARLQTMRQELDKS